MSMSTWSSRLNSVFSYFGIVVTVLIVGNIASTYFLQPNIEPKLRFNGLKKLEQAQQFEGDYAIFTFDLDVDLSPAFHWGTKQVYAYVTAHYKTGQYVDNQVVVWDQIVLSRDTAHIQLKNRKVKYPLRDIGHGLTKNDIKLVFSYQIHPAAGLLVDRHFDDTQHVATFTTGEYTN